MNENVVKYKGMKVYNKHLHTIEMHWFKKSNSNVLKFWKYSKNSVQTTSVFPVSARSKNIIKVQIRVKYCVT